MVFRRAMVSCCAAAALVLTVSCGSQSPGSGSEIGGRVVVSAAASLTDVFDAMATAFESEFPGTDVQLNLAGSSTLREQILGGAPVDVFASADERNMGVIDAAGELESAATIFARNSLQLAVPVSNPGEVTGLADLADDDLLVGICAVGVPCGDFARLVLNAAEVEASIDGAEIGLPRSPIPVDQFSVEAEFLFGIINSTAEIPNPLGVSGDRLSSVRVLFPVSHPDLL